MKNAAVIFAALFCCHVMWARDTSRLTVLGYRWTTSHNTLTFTWPGSSRTSCNGDISVNGYVSGGGNFSANGTTSDTCSTTYRPPSTQNIDIQKPVLFILADTDNSRMVLTCTRNVRWSQCHSLHPGTFSWRNDGGHFEVRAFFGKDRKEEWIKFDVVQQTAVTRQPTPPSREAAPSIEAPTQDAAGESSGFPARWKSMTDGSLHTLRFQGDYIYGEVVLSESAVKAGVFYLMEVKKDGDKYVGKVNWHLSRDGKSCSVSWPIELTLVTPERIEGRRFVPPPNAKIDWNACTYLPPADWRPFSWIPVR